MTQCRKVHNTSISSLLMHGEGRSLRGVSLRDYMIYDDTSGGYSFQRNIDRSVCVGGVL